MLTNNTIVNFKKKAILIFFILGMLLIGFSLIGRPSHDQDWDDLREIQHQRTIEAEREKIEYHHFSLKGLDRALSFIYFALGIATAFGFYWVFLRTDKPGKQEEPRQIQKTQSSDYALGSTKYKELVK